MTVRYYIPDLPNGGGLVDLTDGEAHHAVSVMRVQPGDQIVLFDGEGSEATATIVAAGKRRVQCQVAAATLLPLDNPVAITLAVSLPKGDRSRDLVERLTELGVDRLVPLQCQRSPWKNSENALEKLRRVVIESCKQCRRNRLMQITAPQPFLDFCRQTPATAEACLIAHPGGADVLSHGAAPPPEAVSTATAYRLAIGPEGGFDDAEVSAALAAGWVTVGLGKRILRIETAAISLAVLAQRGF